MDSINSLTVHFFKCYNLFVNYNHSYYQIVKIVFYLFYWILQSARQSLITFYFPRRRLQTNLHGKEQKNSKLLFSRTLNVTKQFSLSAI